MATAHTCACSRGACSAATPQLSSNAWNPRASEAPQRTLVCQPLGARRHDKTNVRRKRWRDAPTACRQCRTARGAAAPASAARRVEALKAGTRRQRGGSAPQPPSPSLARGTRQSSDRHAARAVALARACALAPPRRCWRGAPCRRRRLRNGRASRRARHGAGCEDGCLCVCCVVCVPPDGRADLCPPTGWTCTQECQRVHGVRWRRGAGVQERSK
jgi:hypothetical protein